MVDAFARRIRAVEAPKTGIPLSLNSLATLLRALFASLSDFAPVQSILPVLEIRVAVSGFLNLKTSSRKNPMLHMHYELSIPLQSYRL